MAGGGKFDLVEENLLPGGINYGYSWLTGFTYIKQAGTRTDHEPGLVKAGNAAGVVIRLPFRQICANVGQVDHRGQTGVPRTHLEWANLVHQVKVNSRERFRGSDNAPHTRVCCEVYIHPISPRMDEN